MKRNQNIIYRSEFNFDYQSKASATRCNVLIESIFESRILPKLEKAISNKIPEGVLIELSKLEIDIGKIDEKDLAASLADRIGEALEKVLSPKLDVRAGLAKNNTQLALQSSESYVLGALELFLTKGYFPYAMEESVTIDDLILEAIRLNRNDILKLLKKYGGYDSAISRMAFTLKPGTVDRIIFSLDPVNSKWINDFRQILIFAKKDRSLGQFSDVRFSQTLNYHILKYLLNETSKTFNRKRFTESILNKLIHTFNPNLPSLIKTINKSSVTADVVFDINETLAKLQEERSGKNHYPENEENAALADRHSGSDLINSIELFLINKSVSGKPISLDNLVAKALKHDKANLLKLIKKYRQNDPVLKNLVGHLNPSLFENILRMVGAESRWMLDFGKVLLQAQKEANLNGVRDDNFTGAIHFSILKYALNRTSSIFNKQDFSAFVLKELITAPEAELRSFIQSVQKYSDSSDIRKNILETIGDLQQNGYSEHSGKAAPEMAIGRLIHILNAGKIDFRTTNRSSLKQEIIRAIVEKQNRNQFTEQLNETGVVRVLELFEPQKGAALFRLISSFVKEIAQPSGSRFSVQKSALDTVLYLNETGIRSLDQQEFVLFLIYSAGLENIKTVHSKSFERFVQKQKKINLAKIQALADEEQKYREISAIQKSLSEGRQTMEKEADMRPIKQSTENEYTTIYKQKIVGYFLTTGQLPASYPDLTQKEVQNLFLDLLREKDEFLVTQFRKNEFPETLIERLNLLISKSSSDELENYLLHFFPEEFEVTSKLFTAIAQQSGVMISSRLKGESFRTELFIRSIAAGKGKKSPELFLLSVFEQLISESIADPGKLLQFLLSKSAGGIKSDAELTFYEAFKSGYAKQIQTAKDLSALFNKTPELASEVSDSRTPDRSDYLQRINSLFSGLQFYARHRIFPWWTEPASLPELISELSQISRLQPEAFENAFIRVEKEDHLFEQLLPKLSNSPLEELDKLISRRSSLKTLWSEIREKQAHLDKTKDQARQDKTDIQQFRKEDLKNAEKLFMALYLADDEAILKQAFANSPEIVEQLKTYLSLAPAFHAQKVQPLQWRKALYEFAIDFYPGSQPRRSDRFASHFLRFLKKKYQPVNWEEMLSSVYRTSQSLAHKSRMTFPKELAELSNLVPEIQGENIEISKKLSDLSGMDETGVEVKIYNAGLILFWPFLMRLFERLSLAENGTFINPDSMNRAVYVLQYLVYNDINFPEYNLILNKLLVGMPPEEHLVPFIELTEEEKDGTRSLLNGLIGNWEKVKNSSPEAIQETFLQREGTLKFQTDRVSLEVEKKGVDVLLGSIPWNISLVKLSWMKKPIYVEWI